MLEASLAPECWSNFTKKIGNSGTKIIKKTITKASPTKFYFLLYPN